MAEQDSSFLPENVKNLFSQKSIDKIKSYSIYSEEEKGKFAELEEYERIKRENDEEIRKARLRESYVTYKIFNKIIDKSNEN